MRSCLFLLTTLAASLLAYAGAVTMPVQQPTPVLAVTPRVSNPYYDALRQAGYGGQTTEGFFFIGSPDAPVVLDEFSSLSCAPCGTFRANYIANLSDKIANGQVKRVVIPLTDFGEFSPMQATKGELCAGQQGKFFDMQDLLYGWLEDYGQAMNDSERLVGAAQALGLDVTEFRACLTSSVVAALIQRGRSLADARGIDAVPMLFVNGKRYYPSLENGGRAPSMDEIRGVIEAQVAALAPELLKAPTLTLPSPAPMTPTITASPRASSTPGAKVASVGGRTITASEFVLRARFERWRTGVNLASYYQVFGGQIFSIDSQFGQVYQSLQTPAILGQQVLSDMLDNLVIQEYAGEHGITVSGDEINAQIYSYFQYQPIPMTETPTLTPSPTLTPLVSATPFATPRLSKTLTPPAETPFPTGIPTATPGATERYETFIENSRQYYEQAAKWTGMTEDDIRKIFAEEVLRAKVMQAAVGDPPKQQEQIKVRHILLATREDAEKVLKQLQEGASFAALARAVSLDTGSKDTGGELDWASKGAYVREFDDAIWAARVGDLIGPIDTTANGPNYGFHIIQVVAREMRDLDNTEALDLQTKAFQDWLKGEREKRNAQIEPSWIGRVPSTPSLADMGLPDELPQ